MVRDGWAPYRQFTHALHQTCLAHLLRRCRELQADHPRALLPVQIQTVLQPALGVRDRRAAGLISAHGAAVARGHLTNRLATVLRTARQRGLNSTSVLTTLLRAPTPIVSPALQTRASPH